MFDRMRTSKTIITAPQLWFQWWVPGLLALIVDQISKFVRPLQVLNQAGAWSLPLWPLAPESQLIILGVVIGVLTIFAWWHVNSTAAPRPLVVMLYSVLLGAALSNSLDRWWLGGVRDIWTLSLAGEQLHNNIADWLIVLSVAAIIGLDWHSLLAVQKQSVKPGVAT